MRRIGLFCGALAATLAIQACDVPVADDANRPPRTGEGEGEGEGEFGDGVDGDDCSFNADCGRDLRCGCTDGACVCETGPRGTGANGVDTCVDSNDCQTALCVEGNGAFICSGPCVDDTDCASGLPQCADIAFVGRICIRSTQAP